MRRVASRLFSERQQEVNGQLTIRCKKEQMSLLHGRGHTVVRFSYTYGVVADGC